MSKAPKKSFYKILETALQKENRKKQQDEEWTLAPVIRRLREEKRLSGIELCKRARDLDPKTLSAVEKGRIKNPSIKTLHLIARGLEVSVSDLFRQQEMRLDRHLYLGSQKGAYQVEFPSFGVKIVSFTPLIREFFCGKVILGSRRRLGETFFTRPLPVYISVIVGRLEGEIEGKVVSLREGENLFFNGILAHSFYNPLEREAIFLMVTAPSFL